MTRTERGVVYIAYGANARREVEMSAGALNHYHPDWPVCVIGEPCAGASLINFDRRDKGGRWAKVNLDNLTPFEYTLYLDADTRPRGNLSALFAILHDGWDMVISPSGNQGKELFWHVGLTERAITPLELQYDPVQMQCGVLAFARSERVKKFFTAWRAEWERWQGQDQAAFVRALHLAPLRLWLVSGAYNGGALVSHLYGKAAER